MHIPFRRNVTFTSFFKDKKVIQKSQKTMKIKVFWLLMEGSGSAITDPDADLEDPKIYSGPLQINKRSEWGSGRPKNIRVRSRIRTNELRSGSRRPKNIRIRILNTDWDKTVLLNLNEAGLWLVSL
jgi:hypothetical protein